MGYLQTMHTRYNSDEADALFVLLLSAIKAAPPESGRENLVRVGSLRQGRDKNGTAGGTGDKTTSTTSTTSATGRKEASVSDTLGAAMPGTFLTASDLQELARVYAVCLK